MKGNSISEQKITGQIALTYQLLSPWQATLLLVKEIHVKDIAILA